jgi:hypothetical protein
MLISKQFQKLHKAHPPKGCKPKKWINSKKKGGKLGISFAFWEPVLTFLVPLATCLISFEISIKFCLACFPY